MDSAHGDMANAPDPAASGTSRTLLERVQADDGAAWDRLVTLYGPLVYQWCGRWRLQDCDRADVFQEVFQAVSSHIGQFRKSKPGDTFRGWLRTITRNKVHDLFRRLGREPFAEGGTAAGMRLAQLPATGDIPADDILADDILADDEDRAQRGLYFRALELVRGEFEPHTWKAFWATAVDDRPAKDVADELSMSPGAVRVAKSRVLQRLREELGELSG
jgi:RNA polymerase sigma-70 factor (ECF subfamily)